MLRYHILCLFILSSVYSIAQHPCAEAKLKKYEVAQKTTSNTELAARLMPLYDLSHYDIHIDANVHALGFSGDVTMRAHLTADVDTFCFQLSPILDLDSVFLDGTSINFTRIGEDVIIVPSSTYLSGQLVEIRSIYSGQYVNGGFFSGGINKGKYYDTDDTTLLSFSAIYTMKNWLPAKEMIYDKIDSVDIWVTTELDKKVGSNGILIQHDTVGNSSRFHWKTRYPIDYYLISIAVGDYEIVESFVKPDNLIGDSIFIQNFIFADSAFQSNLLPNLELNDEMMKYYSEHFGLYPFDQEKYGNCFGRLGGGMEHQTMTSIGINTIRVLSHELFHQWFGNYVTCKTWQDVAFNEGFASYGEVLTQEHLFGHQAAVDYMEQVHDDVRARPAGSVFCPDTTDVNRVFNARLTYDKGSAVIGTLRYLIGDSLFFGGMKKFLQDHAYATASWDDLHVELEAYTGLNLDDFFDQWIYGEGYPVVSPRYKKLTSATMVQLSQTNSQPASSAFFKGPLDVLLVNTSGDSLLSRIDWQYQNQIFTIPLGGDIAAIEIDPYSRVLDLALSAVEDSTLSITQVANQDIIQIYPNPTNEKIMIESQKVIHSIFCSDLLGRSIKTFTPERKGAIEISTNEWSEGVYIMQFRFEGGQVVTHQVTKI